MLRHISCWVPGVSLPAETGREDLPARTLFPAAFHRAAEYSSSARDCALARAGFPGICLDTYLGILGPAEEEESKGTVFIFYFYMCGAKRKGKTNLGLSSDSFIPAQ